MLNPTCGPWDGGGAPGNGIGGTTMPAFAANLCTLFTELPLPARIAAAAEAGFDGVEIPYPYDSPAIEIRNALGQAQMPVVLMAAPPPNYTGGTPGFAAQPGGEERFRHDFRRALRYAQTLKARHLHILSGRPAALRALTRWWPTSPGPPPRRPGKAC